MSFGLNYLDGGDGGGGLERTLFSIQSYRSSAQRDMTSKDDPRRNNTEESGCEQTNLRDTGYSYDAQRGFAVKVKSLGPRGVRYQNRLNQHMRQSNGVSENATSVIYSGTAVSPHIKPEYLESRSKSPANAMRAKSMRPSISSLPMVQGQAVKNPAPRETKEGKVVSKQEKSARRTGSSSEMTMNKDIV